ncbi:MAG TPA: VCBS repeat-containing protein [Thermoanaerobaculia bacterium]|nr:VCBS repeat-containing protein [Thermoanaerobaculia bacterium]
MPTSNLRPILAAISAFLLCSLAVQAQVSAAPAAAEAKPEVATEKGASLADTPANPESASTDAANTGPQPPDGVWLKDAEGREYFLDKLAKSAGPYQKNDDHTVRTVWGIVLKIEKEDEENFYYRVYRQTAAETPMSARPEPPSPEMLDAAAKSYLQVEQTDRVQAIAFSKGLPATGQWRHGFVLADMNEDGFLDVVHGAARKTLSVPQIFLGDGKGNWRYWSEAKYAQRPYDYGDVAVADLNGDKHLDMVLAVHLHGLIALLGDGKGNFTDWSKGLDFVVSKEGVAPGFSSRAVTISDWNGDKRPDIIALGEGPRLSIDRSSSTNDDSNGIVIYLNQANGSWVRKDQGTGMDQLFGDTIVLGDLNRDGRKDILTPSNTYSRKDIVSYAKKDGSWQSINIATLRPSGYIRGVTIADWNGDGRNDFADGFVNRELGVWRTGVDVQLAQADGSWKRVSVWAIDGRTSVTALAAGDLNGDKKADLVALTGDGETWVFLGDGKGGFVKDDTGIPKLTDCKGYHAALVDVDKDGKAELISSFAGEASPLLAPGRCPSGGAIQAWQFSERVGTKTSEKAIGTP